MELYLCLTRPVAAGTLYVGDLRTDNARRNGSIDPPAQNRYLRNPDSTPVTLDPEGRVIIRAYGVGAYLAARVAPASRPKPDGYDRAAKALLDRMSQAQTLTVDEVNKILTAEWGGPADLRVNGNLSDLLSILAGRAFLLQQGTVLFDPAGKWLGGANVGTFLQETRPSTYWIFPAHPGPMTKLSSEPNELGPIRRTFPGVVVDSSILKGQLSKLVQGIRIPGNPTTTGRVVVVYDQDGQVVA